MKTLRPNPVAQRELWLFGRYRVLFNVDRLVEHHPGFRRLLQRRLRERSASAAEAARRLTPRRPARPRP